MEFMVFFCDLKTNSNLTVVALAVHLQYLDSVCIQPRGLCDVAHFALCGGNLQLVHIFLAKMLKGGWGRRKVLCNNSYSKRRLALSESVSVILVTRSVSLSLSFPEDSGGFAGGEQRGLCSEAVPTDSTVIRMVSENAGGAHSASVLALV